MKTTLKDLFEREIFESYEILTAKEHIDRQFESISILETPDFENYIIEKNLILTTFYPVKNDVETFKKLLFVLNKKNTAGILIKMKRYIDVIPEEILLLAEQLRLPIIALNYDANLSILFNNILSELQNQDYTNYAFDANYSTFLKQVYDHPSTITLMEIIDKIPDLDLLIQNLDNKRTYCTNDALISYYDKYKTSSNLFQRIQDALYYSEDVIYDDKPIYRFVFMAKNDKRHILHNYIEIIKLMIIVIHQKKIENTLKQNQFLLNFVSNLSSSYTNEEIIEASKRYNWQIIFPIILVLFSIHDKHKSIINPNMIEYMRTVIINKFHLNIDEVRYTILNDQLLFIFNTLETVQINEIMPNVYETLKIKYRELDIKITYSNLIHEASEISKVYFQLSDALVHIKNKNLSINLFTEDQIKLLNLLKNVDYLQMKEYISSVLKPIIDYEKKNQTPLIDTLYQYMESRFSIKETAEKLFIHYNSVRYRLEVIETLGFQVLKGHQGQFELYFALYLYRNFESSV